MPKWRVAVFTGNRADHSLLVPVMHALSAHPSLAPVWWLGGDHMAQDTASLIQQETPGIPIVPLAIPSGLYSLSGPDRLLSSTRHHWEALSQQSHETTAVDALLVLGDRFETFAVVLYAFYRGISIMHLAGGDWTEGGCVDDRLRFLISELASVHCCFSEESATRLRQRDYQQVHVTGSPLVDSLLSTRLTSRAELMATWELDPSRPVVLATQHPITQEGEASLTGLQTLIDALDRVECQILWTAPNRDGLGESMANLLTQAVAQRPDWRYVDTLGRVGYLSWLAACDLVVGNTSSGLLETPYFGKPSVTVGPRQQGRQRAANVLSVGYDQEAIVHAVMRCLTDEAFQQACRSLVPPFGHRPAGPVMAQLLVDWLSR